MTNTITEHKRTSSTVERGIGRWKRRFHILHSEIRVTPPAYVAKVTQVCAMLHNVCKDRNIPEPDGEGHTGEGVDGGDPDPPGPQPPVGTRPCEGLLCRDMSTFTSSNK
ncbi:hypothetical protein E2C01_098051 [Portunus trituberculatus]|uniref:DDE Tnp4 domain-containing protein n=1 Tax=Portunus trituberculatus TaxID=210409 RepID=A0A5B7K6P2_PORTR|nr:hypothetical protein [Portunus trituberculatus]